LVSPHRLVYDDKACRIGNRGIGLILHDDKYILRIGRQGDPF
jgi:hypothetical protein